jgi:hypothetical protein
LLQRRGAAVAQRSPAHVVHPAAGQPQTAVHARRRAPALAGPPKTPVPGCAVRWLHARGPLRPAAGAGAVRGAELRCIDTGGTRATSAKAPSGALRREHITAARTE